MSGLSASGSGKDSQKQRTPIKRNPPKVIIKSRIPPDVPRHPKTKKNKCGAGNPNLVKGCNNVKGPGDAEGAIIAPARKLRVYIETCANFMDGEGWDLLKEQARVKGSRNQSPALKMLAAYGYGNPADTLDITSGGKSLSVADFLSQPQGPPPGAESSGGD